MAPDPVVNGGVSTFTVTTTNNDVSTAATALTLSVDLPSNVSFTSFAPPANCAFDLLALPNTGCDA